MFEIITAGADFEFEMVTLLFQPEDDRLAVPINIISDNIPESEERLELFLGIPAGAPQYVLGSHPTAIVTIADNDG